MAKVVLLDGGVSSRLEEVGGRPLHPQLWSAGEVLTAEGRAAIVVSGNDSRGDTAAVSQKKRWVRCCKQQPRQRL